MSGLTTNIFHHLRPNKRSSMFSVDAVMFLKMCILYSDGKEVCELVIRNHCRLGQVLFMAPGELNKGYALFKSLLQPERVNS